MSKLFIDTLVKGDTILYWDSKTRTEKKGAYVSHRSLDQNRYSITIIKDDGTPTIYKTSRWMPKTTEPKPFQQENP